MPTRRTALAALASLPAAHALPAFAESEADIAAALRALVFSGSADTYAGAISTLQQTRDISLAPALITAYRFGWGPKRPINEMLIDLTGETYEDWFDWMLWQEKNPQIIPHPAYIPFKRDVFLAIDRNFEVFLEPHYLKREAARIRFEEVTWGGVRKDGIPSLDNPLLIPAAEADYLVDDDLVFGVSINGDTRAYPLRIMGWHEMFNEKIGGVHLALAYCTLCGAGILFETEVEGRERPFIFGSSGFLYRSNKLMFDRATHTLWNQFTGEPVMGELANSGIRLKQRPVVIERWADWRARNADTRVLSLNTGYDRDYGSGVVYSRYFSSPDLMFPALVDQNRLSQKDYVFGIRSFAAAKAWPLTAFDGGRVINDSVGDMNVVLIGDTRGRTVRAYDRGDMEFTLSDGRVTSGGVPYAETEAGLEGPDGLLAPRVAGHVAYWFAWDGYHGTRAELFTE